MTKKKATKQSAPPPTARCTKKDPLPFDKHEDGRAVIHDFVTIFEGEWSTTLACSNCGHEVKAAPR